MGLRPRPGHRRLRYEEIFGLFARRADDSGAGLGLTIAKTFVEAHGQRIWVEGRARRRRETLLHAAGGGADH